MALKIGNISRWAKLDPGNVLQFGDENRSQRLRLEFNTSERTHLVVIDHKERERFLGVIYGHEQVEFTTEGPVTILATTEGEVWWYSRDGETDAMELVHEVPFTKVMQRRARNPELEMMMFKVNQNMERRMQAMQAEIAARVAAVGPHDLETGEVSNDDDETENGVVDPAGVDGEEPAAEILAEQSKK